MKPFFVLMFMVAVTTACRAGATSSMKQPEAGRQEPFPVAGQEWGPGWARKVVWYQIFPERFRNGDMSNDPTLSDIKGAWPHDVTSPWQVHPWASDWYALQPYERQNGRDIWFNIQRRRYGGDLEGILAQLDYLGDLGIGAIYLNPVFEAPSLHKYDGATYHHIDPNFGPDPEGDRKLVAGEVPDDPATWVWTSADRLMLKLIGQLHQRGMRVIFDGVFNHMGINSWAFQDVVKNQQASKYRDWFTITSWADPARGTGFAYEGWFGVKELPEIREDEHGIVSGPKEYIFAATRRWMDPDQDGDPRDGIDGWRLDVAFCVSHAFWKQWRTLVKSINPEAYLTAELVDPADALKPYLEGDEFDAVMNYNFAYACAEFFIEEESGITATEFDARLRELRESFHPGVSYVMQNLFGSHDTNRIGSHIVNRKILSYRQWSRNFGVSKADNPLYTTRKPTAAELKLQKLFAIFQMTYVGAPMIYYGDEAGMWGANDPCCRKPMVWPDLEYDDETVLPDGRTRATSDEVTFDHELFGHYQKLVAIRNRHDCLQVGDFRTLLADDARSVYAFSRSHRDQTIIIILNRGKEPCQVTVPAVIGGLYSDLLQEDRIFPVTDGNLSVDMDVCSGRILVRR